MPGQSDTRRKVHLQLNGYKNLVANNTKTWFCHLVARWAYQYLFQHRKKTCVYQSWCAKEKRGKTIWTKDSGFSYCQKQCTFCGQLSNIFPCKSTIALRRESSVYAIELYSEIISQFKPHFFNQAIQYWLPDCRLHSSSLLIRTKSLMAQKN